MPSQRPRVYIPEPFPESALQPLLAIADVHQGPADRACTPAELLVQARVCDTFVITSRERITKELIEAAPRLRHIAKAGARPSNVDFAAAEAAGVLVTWTPGANAVSVAEYTLALMLASAKNMLRYRDRLLGGGWRSYELLGSELHGKTAGLIGFGAIGKEVARRLRAFGVRVLAHDPRVPEAAMRAEGAESASLAGLLAQSHFVSLHCELNEQTRHIIGEAELAAMMPSAVLINTARGPLVDEEALVRALEQGRIGGAALDVFAQEPLGPGARLTQMANVIATPHVAAFSREAIERETSWAIDNAVRVLAGSEPLHWKKEQEEVR